MLTSCPPHTLETNFLYFFSALAQCTATLAGLAAIFAIFRLQWNELHTQEVYRIAAYWISRQDKVAFQDSLPKFRVKERLTGWTTATDDLLASEAKDLLKTIQQREKETGDIGAALSMPLEMWFLIFLSSLAILPVLHWVEVLPGVVIIVLFLLWTLWTGVITARFVQKCLSEPKVG